MRALFLIAVLRRIVNSQRFQAGIGAAMGRKRGEIDEGSEETAIEAGSQGVGLFGRMVRGLFLLTLLAAVSWVAGQLLARRMTIGDEGSDEFQLAVVMTGKEFRSFAGRFRSGTAITVMGGLSIDLREATLDPDGASLDLRTTLGGIEVRVPESWNVVVEQELVGGAFEVEVPAPEERPEGAPVLHVKAVTRVGGGLVTARRT